MKNLAIIIPAYKSIFLDKTLFSLTLQTCKDFSVYIGNDSGDNGIETTVNKYINILDISYTYFDNNIGNISLTKQWERCFKLLTSEEWCWILPDDDYVDQNCVEIFYKNLHSCNFDLFRFNIHYIHEDDTIYKTNPPLNNFQSAFDSLIEKLSFKRPSSIAEFIFRKKKYEQIGFTDIPMAWGSDDLLWFLIGRKKGICGSNDAYVYLRQSRYNISNNYNDTAFIKLKATFLFFKKLISSKDFIAEISTREKKKQFKMVSLKYVMYSIQSFSQKLSITQMLEFARDANLVWGGGILVNLRRFYLNNKRILP